MTARLAASLHWDPFLFFPHQIKSYRTAMTETGLKVYIRFREPTIDLNVDGKEQNSTGSHVNSLPNIDGFYFQYSGRWVIEDPAVM